MDRFRRRAFLLGGLIAAASMVAACGGASRAPDGDAEYGGPALPDVTTTAPAASDDSTTTTGRPAPPAEDAPGPPPPAATARPAPAAAPRSICEGKEGPHPNVAVRKDPSGLLLRLVVADRLCFGPRDGITMELAVKNESGSDIFYDSNKYDAFSIEPIGRAAPRWSEFTCGKPEATATPGPPLVIEPGEALRFVARYPEQPGADRSSSPCHVLDPGDYVVRSFFRTCPDGSRDRGYCDPERVVDVPSATLDIRVLESEEPTGP